MCAFMCTWADLVFKRVSPRSLGHSGAVPGKTRIDLVKFCVNITFNFKSIYSNMNYYLLKGYSETEAGAIYI